MSYENDRQFYVWVVVREYGEDPREVRTGPYWAPDEETIRERCERYNDEVVRVEPAT